MLIKADIKSRYYGGIFRSFTVVKWCDFMNESMYFKAIEVNCYTEIDVTVIGIGDDPDTPDNFIILSRFDEDEDIDNSIGLMTHLSDVELINSIKRIELERQKIVFHLKPNEQNKEVAISIDLDIDDNHFAHLHEYLLLILQGSSIQLIEK